jgi:hypothetical protein
MLLAHTLRKGTLIQAKLKIEVMGNRDLTES